MTNSKASRITVKGLIVNLFLSVIKLISGFLGNSVALLADGINSVGDCFSSIIVFIGIRVAKKPADSNHPYGHYKAELISTIVISIILSINAFQILKSSLELIYNSNFSTVRTFTIYAAIISISLKYYIYKETLSVGNETNSPSVIANAMDYKSDILISIGTLIGVVASILGFKILDPVIAIIVSFVIFKMAFYLIMDVVSQIMDEAVVGEELDRVDKIARKIDGVISTHFIRIRRSGAVYLMDLDLVIRHDISFVQAHDISHRVVEAIKNDNPNLAEVRVHFEPFDDGECR